jgi:hypothetical protein
MQVQVRIFCTIKGCFASLQHDKKNEKNPLNSPIPENIVVASAAKLTPTRFGWNISRRSPQSLHSFARTVNKKPFDHTKIRVGKILELLTP